MKNVNKPLCYLLTVFLIINCFLFSVSASDNSFYVSESVIIISENPSITDKYAAERLKYYLDKITDGNIQILDDSSKFEYEICVGATNRLTEEFSGYQDGSYTIKSDSDTLIINGAGNKGTINGVYAFLEKYCGCHWYESDVIIIPENNNLKINADIDVEYTPFFEYSETDTTSAGDPEFSVANGLTGGIYKNLTPEQGGAVEYLGRSSHTLINQYCKPSDYFDEHPEYFALVRGFRSDTQLCLTNEDVKDIVTQEILDLLEEQHNPDETIQIISITQADNGNYCKCKNCSALDKATGSPAGTMLTFVNEIASRIKSTGKYDNIVFDTFAYQYTRKAPINVVPRDDVIVRLCSIECCFGHTLDDTECKENKEFMQDLKDWSEICDRLYIWNYNLNSVESANIYPNFGVIQRDTQIFYEHNVKGIYQQGVYYIAECDAEFGELKNYLLTKLMQDPYIDLESEMNGYLNAVYGPGGKYIKEFIDIVTQRAVTKNSHLLLEQDARFSLPGITLSEINRCNELWNKAKNETENEHQLSRVKRSELCWRYWKCANMRCEFSRFQHPYLWMKANKDLYNDFVAMGVTRLGEWQGHDLSDNDLRHLTRRIFTWITLYDEPIWDALNPFALKLYKALENLYYLFH